MFFILQHFFAKLSRDYNINYTAEYNSEHGIVILTMMHLPKRLYRILSRLTYEYSNGETVILDRYGNPSKTTVNIEKSKVCETIDNTLENNIKVFFYENNYAKKVNALDDAIHKYFV